MRDIRFRAWDKRTKEMLNVETLHIEDEYVDLFKNNIYEKQFDNPWAKISEVILMQYTGLKDRNGVKIFEGDWIRVETQEKDNGEFPIGYVVRANDKPEMFIALPEQLKETGERQYHLENLYKHYSDEFEVIGNIYENSGLMEEQK